MVLSSTRSVSSRIPKFVIRAHRKMNTSVTSEHSSIGGGVCELGSSVHSPKETPGFLFLDYDRL